MSGETGTKHEMQCSMRAKGKPSAREYHTGEMFDEIHTIIKINACAETTLSSLMQLLEHTARSYHCLRV